MLHSYSHRLICLSILALLLSLHLIYPPSSGAAEVQSDQFAATSQTLTGQDIICPHLLPGCRSHALIWLIRRWLDTHFHFDTTHWGLPVYVVLDEADQWQQVSILCVHLTRSKQ